MGKYQVGDMKEGKRMSRAMSNEHLRVAHKGAYSRNMSGNFDPSRLKLDFEVTKGGRIIPLNQNESIPFRMSRILKKKGIKDPNEGRKQKDIEKKKCGRRTYSSIILGGNRERMLELAFGDQKVDFGPDADNSQIQRNKAIEEWAVEMYKVLAEKYGEDNIASFVVHLDESNPHVHCTIMAITEDNRLSYDEVFGGNKQQSARHMMEFQNTILKVNSKWGLERGEDIHQTGAKHRTYSEWKEWVATEGLPKLKEKKIKQEEKNRSLEDEIKQAERKLKGLRTMAANLETKLATLDPASKEYRDTYGKLMERNEQITETERYLQRLAGDRRDVKDDIESLQRQVNEARESYIKIVDDANISVISDGEATAWKLLRDNMKRRQPQLNDFYNALDPGQQKTFNEIFRSDDGVARMLFDNVLYDSVDSVMEVSTNLFLGFLDKATAISESHGGGSSPGGGWGRKKDEDDFEFGKRCLLMGMHMRHSGPSKKGTPKRGGFKR